ncbi:unnamed protein product [Vicia faba]|uniref:Uncharacterized protein n=1 Tax=Vicia faba TaxID=3906 RepID=A0AAV1APR9_VICFA|nr:unnamed protein product [Vicia faba]
MSKLLTVADVRGQREALAGNHEENSCDISRGSSGRGNSSEVAANSDTESKLSCDGVRLMEIYKGRNMLTISCEIDASEGDELLEFVDVVGDERKIEGEADCGED